MSKNCPITCCHPCLKPLVAKAPLYKYNLPGQQEGNAQEAEKSIAFLFKNHKSPQFLHNQKATENCTNKPAIKQTRSTTQSITITSNPIGQTTKHRTRIINQLSISKSATNPHPNQFRIKSNPINTVQRESESRNVKRCNFFYRSSLKRVYFETFRLKTERRSRSRRVSTIKKYKKN